MKNSEKSINPIMDKNSDYCGSIGLTKREYFAGLAMQSILNKFESKSLYPERICADAIMLADELLKQLEK